MRFLRSITLLILIELACSAEDAINEDFCIEKISLSGLNLANIPPPKKGQIPPQIDLRHFEFLGKYPGCCKFFEDHFSGQLGWRQKCLYDRRNFVLGAASLIWPLAFDNKYAAFTQKDETLVVRRPIDMDNTAENGNNEENLFSFVKENCKKNHYSIKSLSTGKYWFVGETYKLHLSNEWSCFVPQFNKDCDLGFSLKADHWDPHISKLGGLSDVAMNDDGELVVRKRLVGIEKEEGLSRFGAACFSNWAARQGHLQWCSENVTEVEHIYQHPECCNHEQTLQNEEFSACCLNIINGNGETCDVFSYQEKEHKSEILSNKKTSLRKWLSSTCPKFEKLQPTCCLSEGIQTTYNDFCEANESKLRSVCRKLLITYPGEPLPQKCCNISRAFCRNRKVARKRKLGKRAAVVGCNRPCSTLWYCSRTMTSNPTWNRTRPECCCHPYRNFLYTNGRQYHKENKCSLLLGRKK